MIREQPRNITLRPSWARLFLLDLVMVILLYVLALTMRSLLGSGDSFSWAGLAANWPLHLALILGVTVLYSVISFPALVIRLVQGDIEGPVGRFTWARTSFPAMRIDFEKTFASFREKSPLGVKIVSRHGEQIHFLPWIFTPRQVSDLHIAIGYYLE